MQIDLLVLDRHPDALDEDVVATADTLVVDVAAADAQRFCLPIDGKIVLGVDHLFTLSNPALASPNTHAAPPEAGSFSM